MSALDDYRFLKEKNYPDGPALELVGNRYRLDRFHRNCLFRGVQTRQRSLLRRSKIQAATQVAGQALAVDWYNVLITVESYLKGMPVFLCDDGVLRDAAGWHGAWRTTTVTTASIEALLEALIELHPASLLVCLDAPVPHSGASAADLRSRLSGTPIQACEVVVAPSADFVVKNFAGIVASSDSIVLDFIQRALDLPRYVIENRYSGTVPDFSAFFERSLRQNQAE